MKTIEELAKELGVLILHEKALEGDVYVIGNVSLTNLEKLCKAYMQATPVSGEPFGYFKTEPFGWVDCAESDEGAVALYEAPQPAPDTVPEGYALVPLKVTPAIEAIYGNEKCVYQTAQDMHDAMIAEAMKGE